MSVAFGTGTMRASFHDSGKVPDVNDKLKSLVRLGTIASAIPLNILTDIPSGPVDFEGSSWTTRS